MEDATEETPPRFQWKRHHLVDGGVRCWTAGAGIAALCVLAADAIREPSLVVLVLAVFLHSLQDFLLPQSYEIHDDGVVVRSPLGARTASWTSLKGLRKTRTGMLLSPSRLPGPLDSMRGIYLPLPATRTSEMVRFVEERVAR